MPLETYESMLRIAAKWPSFILPLPRDVPANVETADGSTTTEKEKGYEFYYMQWGMHEPPPLPSVDDALFPPSAAPADPALVGKQNPKTATIIFTPLLEYKMRQTFATPYLVLTFYTDLAHTHGIVLLRGEITPSSNANAETGGMDWMLSQQDAQLLTMGLQRFYLWPSAGKGEEVKGSEVEELLRCFHEDAERFRWEDVVRLTGDVGV